MDPKEIEARAATFRSEYALIKTEIAKAIVGHEEIVDGVLTGIFTGGNCLLEGVPGLGKTHLIRTLSQVLDLEFSREANPSADGDAMVRTLCEEFEKALSERRVKADSEGRETVQRSTRLAAQPMLTRYVEDPDLGGKRYRPPRFAGPAY